MLDGTLNVATPPGGSFDPGVYRVISYDGALTNNGLAIGTIPSPSFSVQTAVAKQVNLVNTAGLNLNFWDGAAVAGKNNGTVDGGDGLWHNPAGNDNWTNSLGVPNAPYADATFAIFMAAPGNVTVDNSLGQVRSGGMHSPATAIACWAASSSWCRTPAAARPSASATAAAWARATSPPWTAC